MSPNASTVDPLIIAAVTRVLKSPGSRVNVAQIQSIRIYKANSSGGEAGPVNVWTYNTGSQTFTQASVGWLVCGRTNVAPPAGPDSIGVSLTYTYQMQSQLGSVLRFFGGTGWSTISVSDRTVMAMNPTDKD